MYRFSIFVSALYAHIPCALYANQAEKEGQKEGNKEGRTGGRGTSRCTSAKISISTHTSLHTRPAHHNLTIADTQHRASYSSKAQDPGSGRQIPAKWRGAGARHGGFLSQNPGTERGIGFLLLLSSARPAPSA